MTTIDELEARLLELETRLGVGVEPLAANPPITIGELSDVPAPGSAIASTWAQEVSARVLHRFVDYSALQAWAAPNGSQALTLDPFGRVWHRAGGQWVMTGWTGVNGRELYEAAAATPASVTSGTPVPLTWNETVDSAGLAGPGATVLTWPGGHDGMWLVTFVAQMAGPTASGLVRLAVGGGPLARNYDSPITTSGQIGTVTILHPMVLGSTVAGQIFHTQGSAVSLTSAAIRCLRIGP
jgi:hypothetical protein